MSAEIKSFTVDLSKLPDAKVSFEVTMTVPVEAPATLSLYGPGSLRDLTRQAIDELRAFLEPQVAK